MYITKNVFGTDARYIDLTDLDFFHEAIKLAKEQYFQTNGFDGLTIEDIKKKYTPVIYASTVTKKTAEDTFISRKEMNTRAKRKYLIIDADFNSGEEKKSEDFYNKCIELGENLKTPIVIYPTISYPEKPRFRVVFFTKSSLGEASYWQAMIWLFQVLETTPTDQGDLKIKTPRNAPIFTNEQQIAKIYDTTQDKNLKPLESHHWKFIPKPKIRKIEENEKSYKDDLPITSKNLEDAINLFIKNNKLKEYSEFWKFLHSLARAEFYKQITNNQVLQVLSHVADSADDEVTKLKWKMDNKKLYTTERSRVFGDELLLSKAKSLLDYDEFKEVILKIKN